MSRYFTRKRISPQITPQKSPTGKKATSKNKSIHKKVSKETNNIKFPSKTLTRAQHKSTVKQLDTSIKSNESTTRESKQRILRRRVSNKDNDKVPTKSKKDITKNKSNKSKDESSNPKKRKVDRKPTQNVSSSRQMLLKDSFLNHSVKRQLRSRRGNKHSNDDAESSTNHFTDDKEDDILLLKKTKTNKEKVPVYKSVPLENTVNDGSEVYDFKFDINDSKERLLKKKKKRVAAKKTLIKKSKRNVLSKHKMKKTEVTAKEPVVSKPVETEKKTSVVLEPVKNVEKVPVVSKPVENKEKEISDGAMNNLREQINVDTESLSPDNPSTEGSNASAHVQNTNTRPTIISIENLSHNTVTVMNSPMPKSEDFRPFRPTNIFNNKHAVPHKGAHNASLFEKSFSPILKASENFDPGSPWRVPQLVTFSKVKNVFQSTPQNRINITNGRLTRVMNNESKNYGNVTKVQNTELQNYKNISADKTPNLNVVKKRHMAPRRFGTVITNNSLVQSNNTLEEVSDKLVISTDMVQNTISNVQSSVTLNSGAGNTPKFDNNEDKENVLHYQTPKVISKKGIRKFKSHSPQKLNVQTLKPKENVQINLDPYMDPIPGPSGLQSPANLTEQRVLRQSNLNNFLNIAEMPQSTTIKTPHRIFDDLHSPPINNKVHNKLQEYNTEITTAFGFADEDQHESFTEENDENKENIGMSKVKSNVKPFARLSIGEIKNTLRTTKAKKEMKNENVQTQPVKIIDLPQPKKKISQLDIANFSDTFDLHSEMEDESMSTSTVPLFADLEPSHFNQPPKHSYKRKRNVRFSYSDESSCDDEENVPEQKAKRKKVRKMKKEDEKRLKDWIQDVNRTFDEIEQYDLLVE